MQNNASTRQFFSSQPSEETKKMALLIILGNLNPIDPNLGSCNFVLKYGEQITFKLEYNGGITLGLKIYEFEFNWTTHSE